jgi:hypothetical protein
MTDDGRIFVLLGLAGVAGASVARGSRGIARPGRPVKDPELVWPSCCRFCGLKIVDGRVESGAEDVDWMTEDGDFGCGEHPDSNDEGVASHEPILREGLPIRVGSRSSKRGEGRGERRGTTRSCGLPSPLSLLSSSRGSRGVARSGRADPRPPDFLFIDSEKGLFAIERTDDIATTRGLWFRHDEDDGWYSHVIDGTLGNEPGSRRPTIDPIGEGKVRFFFSHKGASGIGGWKYIEGILVSEEHFLDGLDDDSRRVVEDWKTRGSRGIARSGRVAARVAVGDRIRWERGRGYPRLQGMVISVWKDVISMRQDDGTLLHQIPIAQAVVLMRPDRFRG